jgi:hypothetical protein
MSQKRFKSPDAAESPATKRRESPGRKLVTTSPVSRVTITKRMR